MAINTIPIIKNFVKPFFLFNSNGRILFAISGDNINETISKEQIKYNKYHMSKLLSAILDITFINENPMRWQLIRLPKI